MTLKGTQQGKYIAVLFFHDRAPKGGGGGLPDVTPRPPPTPYEINIKQEDYTGWYSLKTNFVSAGCISRTPKIIMIPNALLPSSNNRAGAH